MVFYLLALWFGDHLRRCTALPKHWAENDKNRNNNNHLFSSAQNITYSKKLSSVCILSLVSKMSLFISRPDWSLEATCCSQRLHSNPLALKVASRKKCWTGRSKFSSLFFRNCVSKLQRKLFCDFQNLFFITISTLSLILFLSTVADWKYGGPLGRSEMSAWKRGL